jgi:hypothetical protein
LETAKIYIEVRIEERRIIMGKSQNILVLVAWRKGKAGVWGWHTQRLFPWKMPAVCYAVLHFKLLLVGGAKTKY